MRVTEIPGEGSEDRMSMVSVQTGRGEKQKWLENECLSRYGKQHMAPKYFYALFLRT